MNALESMNLARAEGITPSALHVLLAVMSNPPMMASAAARICGITPAAVTGIADVLQRGGFLERLQSLNDRRAKLLAPTESAFRIFEPIICAIEEVAL